MKVLVYGAGPLGSLYAAKLHEAGVDVSLLARGQRLADLRAHDVVLEDAFSGMRATYRVPVVEMMNADDAYDLILVVMRKAHCLEILPELVANRHAHTVLFLQNNPTGFEEYIAALGAARVMVGFPSSGGTRHDPVMRVVSLEMAPMPIGEVDGRITDRARAVAALLRRTGKRVEIRCDMDAWLVSHIAMLLTYFGMYAADLDLARYARTRDAILLGVRACTEGLRTQQAAGIPIRPALLQLLAWTPEPLMVALLQVMAGTKAGEFGIEELRVAGRREDLASLIAAYQKRVAPGGPSPAIARMEAHVAGVALPLPDGSRQLPLKWRSVWLAGLALLAIIIARMNRRRDHERNWKSGNDIRHGTFETKAQRNVARII